MQSFQIGYAPTNGDALVRFLLRKGFSKKDLSEAGLTNRFGGDLFKGRMMVPLMDSGGQVIGFTARIIEDDPKAPKYLNTPQTLLYDKSRHVFGFSQAKEAIRNHGYTVLVEGNLDVVSSHQAGVRQVVATAGTALTEHHLKALVRLSPQVRLAFDEDKAGLAATERAIPIAQNVGAELTIVSLPNTAKDPDELIKQDSSLWQHAINSAEPAVDWLLRQYESRVDLTTAIGKRHYTTAGISLIRHLSDPVDRDHYMQLMSTRTGSSLEALNEKLTTEQEPTPSRKLRSITKAVAETTKPDSPQQDDFLAVLLLNPPLRHQLTPEHVSLFHYEHRQAVAQFLLSSHRSIYDTPKELQKHDTYVKILLLRAETRYGSWDDKELSLESARLLRQIIIQHNKQKRDSLIEQLRNAEDQQDDSTAAQLRTEINALIKEIKHGT